jgi:drug/metabolite transporter (DMT)-like permease
MGYVYALGAFFCIGSYLVPARFSNNKGLAFFPYMALGMLVLDLFRIDSLKALWAHPLWFWGSIIAGLVWALGQAFGNLALSEISMAKAAVIFNFNSFFNIALGLALFHEASGFRAYGLILAGGLLLFIGAWGVSKASASPAKEGNLKKGIIYSCLASVFWGTYFTPVKALQTFRSEASLNSMDILSGLMLGGAVTGLLVGFLAVKPKFGLKDVGLGLGTAILWAVGTIFFLLAIDQLGLARAVPIINSNALVYAAWSLFVFKELPLSQGPKVFGGTLIVVLGIVLLALA